MAEDIKCTTDSVDTTVDRANNKSRRKLAVVVTGVVVVIALAVTLTIATGILTPKSKLQGEIDFEQFRSEVVALATAEPTNELFSGVGDHEKIAESKIKLWDDGGISVIIVWKDANVVFQLWVYSCFQTLLTFQKIKSLKSVPQQLARAPSSMETIKLVGLTQIRFQYSL